jgi:hypothetical protein
MTVEPLRERKPLMLNSILTTVLTYYFFIKIIFFFSLVRSQIKFDALKDHWLFLGLLYTAGIAFLSYAFIANLPNFPWAQWQVRVAQSVGVSPWLAWVGETFLLSTLYFKLMAKFDEGVIFWTLLLLGIPVAMF